MSGRSPGWRSGPASTGPRREGPGLGAMSSFGFPARHAVAEPAHGFDGGGADFAAQPPDKHLDRVRIAIEVLRVDVLAQLRLRDDLAAMVHQVRQHPELVA